jgi:Zn-dependent protease with chaperone function
MRNSATRPQSHPRARVLHWSLAVTLILCTIANAHAASPSACQETRARANSELVEIKDTRVLSVIRTAIKITGFRTRVVLCELSLPYLSATVENQGGYYRVGITRMLLERATRAELLAVVGHEVAHIVLGHRAPMFELAHNRAAEYERAADALSARWFGKAPMRSLLEKLRVDAGRLPEGSLRERALAELDERISSLK